MIMKIRYRTQFGQLLIHLGLTGDAVEIGVAEGRHSEVLIRQLAITKLYMIDAWDHLNQSGDGGYPQSWHDNNLKESHERVESFKEKAVFLKGLSRQMIREIPDDSLVLAYIDGDHSYQGCLNDLTDIYQKVKTGGVIALHDYLNFSYGVNAAVKSFLIKNDYYPHIDLQVTEEDGDLDMVSCWFVKK